MELVEAQDVRQRLNTIRRLIEDFDKAVDFSLTAKETFQVYSEQIPKLKQQSDGLTAVIKAKKDTLAQVEAEYPRRIAELEKTLGERRAELSKTLSDLADKIARHEKAHKERMTVAEREYKEKRDKFDADLAGRQKILEVINADIEARKKAVLAL